MPIYEYRCESCGERLEKLQRRSDDRLIDCPACGAPALKRLVSAASFRLKGSGWYETDFKKGNKHNLAESPSSGSGSKTDTGKDSKTAETASAVGSDKKPPTKPETKSGNAGVAGAK